MIIPAASLTKSLWKNGGGWTTEIARSGSPSFDWRISFADVNADGPFSEFPGCDRWLVVWRGQGLHLDGTPLLPFEPSHFSGDTARSCTLIGGPVTDLGVIYKRDKFISTMRTLTDVGSLPSLGDVNFLFLVQGKLSVDGSVMQPQDTLQFERDEQPNFIKFTATVDTPDFRAIFISLNRRSLT